MGMIPLEVHVNEKNTPRPYFLTRPDARKVTVKTGVRGGAESSRKALGG
jgi:hypothetical protein